jgi:hypothetical protein
MENDCADGAAEGDLAEGAFVSNCKTRTQQSEGIGSGKGKEKGLL